MNLCHMLDNGKAKPCTARSAGMTLIHSIKTFKYMRLMFFGNANAVVRNSANYPSIFLIQCNLHFAAFRRILDRIVNQIEEHLS